MEFTLLAAIFPQIGSPVTVSFQKMTEKHLLGYDPITCHAWNRDRSQLAVSLNSNEVSIFQSGTGRGAGWKLLHVLSDHALRVTSLDWAPKTNRIVTCSADRNAYVWIYDQAEKKWKPTLVLLRINRAATCVKWSPKENKFAVGCGARLIAICYFEEENDWWVSKHIKKPIKSTVTCVDWHPGNILLAAGSTDYKVRVYSAYVKEIEEKPAPLPWGSKMPLGQVMAEYRSTSSGGGVKLFVLIHPLHSLGFGPTFKLFFAGGWVHSVSFSPSGNRLCWTSQDSAVSVVDASQGQQIATIRTEFQPFLRSLWLTDDVIVAAVGSGRVVIDTHSKVSAIPMLFAILFML
ncbi:unnamed protein product [Cyprideis torosa]|uniref:Arp2/3 complex 41 kDa subunit n=1 Tax=Cyprideis torosa TaxID=163714 RepID=A0A7R8WM39_9CRUS|nr:unnamed protein product [Cyprideis torosa]CAG0902325.1 unnamed protein product [Cyprideis torosa]